MHRQSLSFHFPCTQELTCCKNATRHPLMRCDQIELSVQSAHLLTTHVNKTQKWVRWVRCLAYDPLICKPTISHTFLYCCRLEVKLSPITAVLQNHLFFSADKEIKRQNDNIQGYSTQPKCISF